MLIVSDVFCQESPSKLDSSPCAVPSCRLTCVTSSTELTTGSSNAGSLECHLC